MLGYAIAAGAAAAVVTAGYHTMAPRSQLYGRTFIGTRGRRQLALTFDDGPNDPYTLRLLDVLTRHDVRATFFVLGKFAKERPDILRDIVHAGHALGNHTYSHRNLIFATRAQLAAELRDCATAIGDATGENCHPVSRDGGAFFRPPFGARRPGVLRAARQMGYLPIMWSVAGRDWTRRPAVEIEAAIARQLRGGEVILLHDGSHVRMGADRARTVDAVDRLLTRCRREGYEFVTVPQMLAPER